MSIGAILTVAVLAVIALYLQGGTRSAECAAVGQTVRVVPLPIRTARLGQQMENDR